jgi:hypothetical protein
MNKIVRTLIDHLNEFVRCKMEYQLCIPLGLDGKYYPNDSKYTLSFDLLFRGLEITTGGQRIHDYHEQ